MAQKSPPQTTVFDPVRAAALHLPDTHTATKYDGSPILKANGKFMAGLAMHPSAEPNTLIVRSTPEERDALLEEAPETYYLTDHYRRHPVILARLSQLNQDALRDLLTVSWQLTKKRSSQTAPVSAIR